MKNNVTDNLNDVFEVGTDLVEVEKEKTSVSVPQDVDNDYKYARENLYGVIEKGTEALDTLIDLAKASEHPRAFEVVSQLTKTLVDANKASGAKGYTYSHHKLNTHNLEALKYANKNGFTINASCESLTQADDAIRQGLPAVCVVNSNKVTPTHTPDGHKVTICPAQLHEKVSCSNCKLCSYSNRSQVVAFLAHGAREKKVNVKLHG